MAGAAVATVLGQIATSLLAVWYLFHAKLVKPGFAELEPDREIIVKTLSLGFCSFLAQLSLFAAMMAINNMIQNTALWMISSVRCNMRRSRWRWSGS